MSKIFHRNGSASRVVVFGAEGQGCAALWLWLGLGLNVGFLRERHDPCAHQGPVRASKADFRLEVIDQLQLRKAKNS